MLEHRRRGKVESRFAPHCSPHGQIEVPDQIVNWQSGRRSWECPYLGRVPERVKEDTSKMRRKIDPFHSFGCRTAGRSAAAPTVMVKAYHEVESVSVYQVRVEPRGRRLSANASWLAGAFARESSSAAAHLFADDIEEFIVEHQLKVAAR